MPSQKKINQVKTISDLLNRHKNFVLIKYQNVSTSIFNDLRRKLKKTQSFLMVVKNTLFEKSIHLLGDKEKRLNNVAKRFFPLKEPTAVIYLHDDWTTGLKTFYQFSQNFPFFSFKFGLLDQQIYDQDQLIKLSQLPTKEELKVKLLSIFKRPMINFIVDLKFNLYRLVNILNSQQTGRR